MKKSIFLLLLTLFGTYGLVARECIYSHEEIFTLYQEDEHSSWHTPDLSEKKAKECAFLKTQKPQKIAKKRSSVSQKQERKRYSLYCVSKYHGERPPQKIGSLNSFQDELFFIENKHYISQEDITHTVNIHPDQERFVEDQKVFVVEAKDRELLIGSCHALFFKEGEVMVAKNGKNNKFFPVVMHESQYVFARIIL